MEKMQLIKKLKRAFNIKGEPKYFQIFSTYGKFLIYKLKRKAKYYENKLDHIHTKTFFDRDLEVVLPEIVSANLYLYGFYDHKVCTYIIHELKKGDTFIDVGAHIGFMSLLANELVGDNGKVYSFEPTPSTFAQLSKNINTSKNIVPVNAGVMDSNSEIDIIDYGWKYSAYNTFSEGRVEVGKHAEITKIKVKTYSLDYFVEQYELEPRLIKIDAENSEAKVLEGSVKTIEKFAPSIIVEVGDSSETGYSKKIIDFLLAKDYKAYEFKDWGLVKHDIKLHYSDDNLLFVKN